MNDTHCSGDTIEKVRDTLTAIAAYCQDPWIVGNEEANRRADKFRRLINERVWTTLEHILERQGGGETSVESSASTTRAGTAVPVVVAYADLLAAAPDLYKALKLTVDALLNFGDSEYDDKNAIVIALTAAKAAIAKADQWGSSTE